MIDCKCSFSIPLITKDFACEKAQIVTRRAGPDIACSSELASESCIQVYSELKNVALPAFGAEDDLLKTPASVYTKIQFGGLLGLQKYIICNEPSSEKVENIYQLVQRVLQDQFEYENIMNEMTAYKMKRKRKTKKY